MQVWRSIGVESRAAAAAAEAARETHLEQIAFSFRQLWLAHAVLRCWRAAPAARRAAAAALAAAAEDRRLSEARVAAADSFRRIFLLHTGLRAWKESFGHAQMARQLEAQHLARRQAMERAVQVSCKKTFIYSPAFSWGGRRT